MSFWGMSQSGKEAQGFFPQYGAWNWQQYKDWLGRAGEYEQWAKPYRNWAYQYWTGRTAGLPSPGDIHATGSQILPSLEGARERRRENVARIAEGAGNIPSAWNVSATVGDIQNLRGGAIAQNQQQQGQIVGDLANRVMGREGQSHEQVVGNIKDTYGSLENYINSMYGGMDQNVVKTFANLLESGEITFEDAAKEIESLKPGGELQQARVARSYAPMIASTADRLRRGGVGVESPQGIAALQRGETARARGMDEAAAASVLDYVREKTGLGRERQAMRERVEGERVAAQLGLGREQAGVVTGLKREMGQEFRGELLRNLAASQGIDASQAEAQAGILERTLDRNLGLLKDRESATLLARALEREDWDTMRSVLERMSEEELTQLGLENTNFQAGFQYVTANLNDQDRAAMQLLGMSDQDYQRMFEAAQQALQFGGNAEIAYQIAFQLEQANAGWGKKFLAGLAAGLAPVIGGTIGGTIGGPGGRAIGGAIGGAISPPPRRPTTGPGPHRGH